MIIDKKKIMLKNGEEALLRSPEQDLFEAEDFITFMREVSGETIFLMRYPEEWTLTAERELEILTEINKSSAQLMMVCEIAGELAGVCSLVFNSPIKIRHRATVAISLRRRFWNLGAGTAMFKEMIALARDYGVTQLELDYIEGNERARALYEKMGFRIVGERPNAIRLKDGTMLKEYSMIKEL